jgi:Ca-activated chloride channel homolog
VTSRRNLIGMGAAALLSGPAALSQESNRPTFRVKVDMVVLGFTVTDNKGRYVNGLKPSDFRILEDGIVQKLNTFAEGNKPVMQILDDGSMKPLAVPSPGEEAKAGPDVRSDAFVGTNVFVLFDTSNYMYRGFVYASDAIADFVRGLDRADSVAVYTFSRNLTRAAELTKDRNDAILGLRKAVAGDDSALYNTLLLTLRDAAKVPGRKVVIVFSNGPDNASMVAPDDVRAVAEDEGIPIYVISTAEASATPSPPASSAASPPAPAARPTSPKPGRSRSKPLSPSARTSATPTPSPTTRRPIPTRASARSRRNRR